MTKNCLSGIVQPWARSVRRVLLCRMVLLALAVVPVAWPLSAAAQIPAGPSRTYLNKNLFTMPVSIDPRARGSLREVQLYVKDHPAKAWMLKDTKPPTVTSFSFQPPQDGEYWFTVVTVDQQGVSTPPDVNAPGVQVIVVVIDTQMPVVDLLPQPPLSTGQVVVCQVRDLNPDPNKTRFEYQTADQQWRMAEVVGDNMEAYLVPAQAKTTGKVRVTVVDRAGNPATRELNLNSTTPPLPLVQESPVVPPPPEFVAVPPANKVPEVIKVPEVVKVPELPTPVQTVEHKEKTGTCKEAGTCKDAGNSGTYNVGSSPSLTNKEASPIQQLVHKQEVPATKSSGPVMPVLPPDTLPKKSSVKTPPVSVATPAAGMPPVYHLVNQTHVALEYQIEEVGPSGVGKVEIYVTSDRGKSWQRLGEDADRKSPAEIDLPGEGVYGVCLVASNGSGFGATPPKVGETPDWWIEVDLTQPVVELTSVQLDAKNLIIQWNARDKNLGDAPVDLYFSVNKEGPWTTIARGVKNDGRHSWTVPQHVGQQAFIRLVVSDRAGNICQSETANPVVLDDQSRPRVHVINMVSPGTRVQGPSGN